MRGWGLAVVVLACSLAAVAPAHAEPEPAVCTATGTWTFFPGVTFIPVAQATGGTLTLTCPVLGDDAGVWTLSFVGGGIDSCEVGEGTAGWVAPSAGPGTEGAVRGLGFTYVHTTPFAVDLAGTVPSAGPPAEVHQFAAHLVWTSLPAGLCVAPPGALVTVAGAAVLED